MSLIGERIRQMIAEGKKGKEITYELGISQSYLYNIKKREGIITSRTPKQKVLDDHKDEIIAKCKAGMRAMDIYKEYGVSQTPFFIWAKKQGLRFVRGKRK